jgi:hypothetical protein
MQKKCGCGREYNEFTWQTLHYVGTYHEPDPNEPDLELRNCQCKSTIAVPLPMGLKHAKHVP